MTDAAHQIRTEEQRERLHDARNHGRLCAACGRHLTDDETVYIEQFSVDARKLPGSRLTVGGTHAQAPVGRECASPEMLQGTEGQTPERCAGCDRPVFYRLASSRREQALCSRRCAGRAAVAKRAARMGAI